MSGKKRAEFVLLVLPGQNEKAAYAQEQAG